MIGLDSKYPFSAQEEGDEWDDEWEDEADDGAGDIASVVLRVQLGLLSCAFVIAFMLGTLAPSKGNITAAMALPEWNDGVQPWTHEVETFASRVATGFNLRQEVALEFSPWILEAALRQQLSPELLAGLVLTESSFRKNVKSPVGAIGPAQVRPEYWAQFCGTDNLGDPAENIYCGAQILAYYVERCGAEACALSAYNVGPYTEKRQDAGRRYVAKVAAWRDRLAEIGKPLGSKYVSSVNPEGAQGAETVSGLSGLPALPLPALPAAPALAPKDSIAL